MQSSYYALVYCPGLDNDLEQEELIQTLERKISGLYDSYSKSPAIDDYLRPTTLGGGEIIFGCQNPDEVISYAKQMRENATKNAWEVIDEHKKDIIKKTVNHQDCRDLSRAFDVLSGNVNDETDTFVISPLETFDAWPDDDQLNDIESNPDQWALCWVDFEYIS